jgi:phage gp16-like protein
MPKKSTKKKRRGYDLRTRQLATIHTARKVLGLDEDTYRACLGEWFPEKTWPKGKPSAGDLSADELQAAIQHFRRMGFEPRKSASSTRKGQKLSILDDDPPRIQKIKAMWLHLWRLGAVDNPSAQALGRFCKRHVGKDSVQWLMPTDQNTMIEILKRWTSRVEHDNQAAAEG